MGQAYNRLAWKAHDDCYKLYKFYIFKIWNSSVAMLFPEQRYKQATLKLASPSCDAMIKWGSESPPWNALELLNPWRCVLLFRTLRLEAYSVFWEERVSNVHISFDSFCTLITSRPDWRSNAFLQESSLSCWCASLAQSRSPWRESM